MNKNKLAKMRLNKNMETFKVYINNKIGIMAIYLAKNAKILLFFIKKMIILAKY